MSKITLTEEELTKLLEAVNAGAEPTPELAGKLFPTLMEKLGQEGKFDFETLNRIKIPTIEYAGKRSEGVILASAAALGQSAPLQAVRSFGEPGEDGWKNLIIQGDNLQFLKTAYLNQDPLIKNKVKGKVKLMYLDPPFATKSDFQGGEGARSYSDKIDSAEFIENLRERLVFLREMLADDGSIYIHLDMKKGHYLKIILDEIFGDTNLQNEIIWKRTPFAGSSKARSNKFPVNHDTIFFYSKSGNYLFNQQYIAYDPKYIKRFSNPDTDPNGPWQSVSLKTFSKETFDRLKTEGKLIPPQRDLVLGGDTSGISMKQKENRLKIFGLTSTYLIRCQVRE